MPVPLPFPVRGKVLVSACEPSADLYASRLMDRLKRGRPGLKFIGLGGPEMKACGAELLRGFNDLMSFGLSASALNLRSNWLTYRAMRGALARIEPDVFMPVAYPGINLPLCRDARRMGIRTIYLLPPQIWAWAGFRKVFVKHWVDQVITFFPFERDFYLDSDIPVVYLENPLAEEFNGINRTDPAKRVGFMPGSRPQEITRNMPIVNEIIERIKVKSNGVRFVLILRDKINLHDTPLPSVPVITIDRHQAMKNCDLLVTCSGTASLEASFLNVPQVFFNRPSRFDYHLLRRFITIREFNLANLYHGRKIAPVHIDRNIRDLVDRIIEDMEKTGLFTAT